MSDPVGLYVSIPFCRGKCTFCNFASDAFSPGDLPAYVQALIQEIDSFAARTQELGAIFAREVDTVYLGGGTPSLLSPCSVQGLFDAIRRSFNLLASAEITVECAPGQLDPATLEAFQREGVNRLSFGVQSFVDAEAAAVGRQHTAAQCFDALIRARAAGISNLGLDLIAGLPFQTELSWRRSLEQAIGSEVDHLSVYLFEMDEDSRLGRELLEGGNRFSAGHVPSEEAVADFYEIASDLLPGAGFEHYEISNFARPGRQSAHNLKYWQRAPYIGFGLDAHSLLRTSAGPDLRYANPDNLRVYLQAHGPAAASPPVSLLPLLSPVLPTPHLVREEEAFEELLFLGLRRNAGLRLADLHARTPPHLAAALQAALATACSDGLLTQSADRIALTPRGRLLSNQLFSDLLLASAA